MTKTNYSAPSTGNALPDFDKQNQESLEHNEMLLREEQLEELKITNPLAYEELMRNEGLEDDERPSDDEPV